MGFSICSNRNPDFRFRLTVRDREYANICLKCPQTHLCGGFSVWNDARFCRGPGDVCWDGCRAICSKNQEKISYHALALGADHCNFNRETGLFVPKLTIEGQHPWQPWHLDWPDVGFQLNAHANGEHQPLYTISMKHLFYVKRGSWSPQKDLRERFAIPKSSRLAITMTTHDALLDWLAGDLDDFADELAAFEGVDFMFCPNFSVYGNYPRMDNLFQIKRKWLMLEKLQERGVRVVPDICFVTSKDFENQLEWMRANAVDCMLMNFQVHASTADTAAWKSQVKGAQLMQKKLGWPVQLIAYGAIGGDRMESILVSYPNTTFIDAKSYRLAEFHKRFDGTMDRDVDVKDLFHANAFYVRAMVAGAKGKPMNPLLGDREPRQLTD